MMRKPPFDLNWRIASARVPATVATCGASAHFIWRWRPGSSSTSRIGSPCSGASLIAASLMPKSAAAAVLHWKQQRYRRALAYPARHLDVAAQISHRFFRLVGPDTHAGPLRGPQGTEELFRDELRRHARPLIVHADAHSAAAGFDADADLGACRRRLYGVRHNMLQHVEKRFLIGQRNKRRRLHIGHHDIDADAAFAGN